MFFYIRLFVFGYMNKNNWHSKKVATFRNCSCDLATLKLHMFLKFQSPYESLDLRLLCFIHNQWKFRYSDCKIKQNLLAKCCQIVADKLYKFQPLFFKSRSFELSLSNARLCTNSYIEVNFRCFAHFAVNKTHLSCSNKAQMFWEGHKCLKKKSQSLTCQKIDRFLQNFVSWALFGQ